MRLYVGAAAYRPRCRPDRWPFEDEALVPDLGTEEGTATNPDQFVLLDLAAPAVEPMPVKKGKRG